MIRIGPYTFTTTDALRTIGKTGALWDTQLEGRCSPAAVAIGDALASRMAVAVGEPGPAETADLHDLGLRAASQLAESAHLATVLADVWNTLQAGAGAARSDGQMPATTSGSVVQVSGSKGGVPKLALAAAEVGFRGLVGDSQRVRMHHGQPWQALCIYSDEVIAMLQREGHPISWGSAGENVTVRGLSWEQVRPGVCLRIGTAFVHVQAYADPCRTIRESFVNGQFQRIHVNRGPVSRVYASVLAPGRMAPGDDVILEPPAATRG